MQATFIDVRTLLYVSAFFTLVLFFYIYQLQEETKTNVRLRRELDDANEVKIELLWFASAMGAEYHCGRGSLRVSTPQGAIDQLVFCIDVPGGQIQLPYTQDTAFVFAMHPIYDGELLPESESNIRLLMDLAYEKRFRYVG